MKTLLSILTLGIIFLAGCTDKDSIVAPENNQASSPISPDMDFQDNYN